MQVKTQASVFDLKVWGQGYDFEVSLTLARTDTSFSQKLVNETMTYNEMCYSLVVLWEHLKAPDTR